MLFIFCGPSACGKTSLGKHCAQHWKLPFFDGDDFHSQENLQKMQTGTPLSDSDRLPWLDRLNTLLKKFDQKRHSLVLACSALSENHRLLLSREVSVQFIYLSVSPLCLAQRLQNRSNHFFHPKLLESQLATLEIPKNTLKLNGELPLDTLRKTLESHFNVYFQK